MTDRLSYQLTVNYSVARDVEIVLWLLGISRNIIDQTKRQIDGQSGRQIDDWSDGPTDGPTDGCHFNTFEQKQNGPAMLFDDSIIDGSTDGCISAQLHFHDTTCTMLC